MLAPTASVAGVDRQGWRATDRYRLRLAAIMAVTFADFAQKTARRFEGPAGRRDIDMHGRANNNRADRSSHSFLTKSLAKFRRSVACAASGRLTEFVPIPNTLNPE